jgi:hypothetical protein
VVQGAVIYGIEKTRHADANYMSAMKRSYGVVVDGEFKWLVRRGDLVLSKERKIINSESFSILPSDMSNFQLVLYTFDDDDGRDKVPDLFKTGQHGKWNEKPGVQS